MKSRLKLGRPVPAKCALPYIPLFPLPIRIEISSSSALGPLFWFCDVTLLCCHTGHLPFPLCWLAEVRNSAPFSLSRPVCLQPQSVICVVPRNFTADHVHIDSGPFQSHSSTITTVTRTPTRTLLQSSPTSLHSQSDCKLEIRQFLQLSLSLHFDLVRLGPPLSLFFSSITPLDSTGALYQLIRHRTSPTPYHASTAASPVTSSRSNPPCPCSKKCNNRITRLYT